MTDQSVDRADFAHEDYALMTYAAKAAGYQVDEYFGRLETEHRRNSGAPGVWRPLKNDADALRLAVDLSINVMQNLDKGWVCATYYAGGVQGFEAEQWQDDKYRATRRAIVKAAAHIGKHNLETYWAK